MWNSFKNDLKIVSTQAFTVSECQFWDLDFWMNDHKKKLIRDCATYLFSFSNQNMFSLSVFQSHCVVVVKLDIFLQKHPTTIVELCCDKSQLLFMPKSAQICARPWYSSAQLLLMLMCCCARLISQFWAARALKSWACNVATYAW